MVLLKEVILGRPVIILGIILIAAGFASILLKVFSVTKSGTRNKYGTRETNKESKYSKQVLVIVLVALLVALIVLIIKLGKVKYG